MNKLDEDINILWCKLLHSQHKSECILCDITEHNYDNFIKFIINSNSIIIDEYQNSVDQNTSDTENLSEVEIE